MPRTSFDKILRYLQSIFRLQGIAIDQFAIPSAVHEEAPTINQLRERFIRGSQNIPYSERATRTRKITLYGRLQSLGVFDKVFSDPVIEDIRVVLEVFEIENRERALLGKRCSSHDFPVRFHLSLLQAIFQHVQRLHKLPHDYDFK